MAHLTCKSHVCSHDAEIKLLRFILIELDRGSILGFIDGDETRAGGATESFLQRVCTILSMHEQKTEQTEQLMKMNLLLFF